MDSAASPSIFSGHDRHTMSAAFAKLSISKIVGIPLSLLTSSAVAINSLPLGVLGVTIAFPAGLSVITVAVIAGAFLAITEIIERRHSLKKSFVGDDRLLYTIALFPGVQGFVIVVKLLRDAVPVARRLAGW